MHIPVAGGDRRSSSAVQGAFERVESGGCGPAPSLARRLREGVRRGYQGGHSGEQRPEAGERGGRRGSPGATEAATPAGAAGPGMRVPGHRTPRSHPSLLAYDRDVDGRPRMSHSCDGMAGQTGDITKPTPGLAHAQGRSECM